MNLEIDRPDFGGRKPTGEGLATRNEDSVGEVFRLTDSGRRNPVQWYESSVAGPDPLQAGKPLE